MNIVFEFFLKISKIASTLKVAAIECLVNRLVTCVAVLCLSFNVLRLISGI